MADFKTVGAVFFLLICTRGGFKLAILKKLGKNYETRILDNEDCVAK